MMTTQLARTPYHSLQTACQVQSFEPIPTHVPIEAWSCTWIRVGDYTKKKVTINYLKEPEIAHLITPDLISKLGSITFPASSFPFEISKVARIIAISVNNDASASSFPGHILNRKRKGGKKEETHFKVIRTNPIHFNQFPHRLPKPNTTPLGSRSGVRPFSARNRPGLNSYGSAYVSASWVYALSMYS